MKNEGTSSNVICLIQKQKEGGKSLHSGKQTLNKVTNKIMPEVICPSSEVGIC